MVGTGLLVIVNFVVGLTVALLALYWVIRLAVRHALMDADDRRARAELETEP